MKVGEDFRSGARVAIIPLELMGALGYKGESTMLNESALSRGRFRAKYCGKI